MLSSLTGRSAVEAGFFRRVLGIAVPVTLQAMLQSSFSIVDQIMIGQLGSTAIAGAGLAGKFISIYSVIISAVGTVAGIMIAQYLGREDRAEVRRSFFLNITAAAAVAVAFLPETLNVVVALYPIFFAMSIQWSSFGGARGFYSSTIFSTNNTKQTSLALANYLCDHDRAQLRKLKVFALTLLCFHIGAAVAYFAVTWWYIRGALAVLPLIVWAFFLSVCERRHEALAEEPETIPDSSAHPTSNA